MPLPILVNKGTKLNFPACPVTDRIYFTPKAFINLLYSVSFSLKYFAYLKKDKMYRV